MRAAAGLTLLELLIVMTIAAILIASVPQFHGLLLDARMTSSVNALLHSIHLARVQAQASLQDVAICRSTTGQQCAAPGDWGSGWIAFINLDQDDPPVVDSGETIVHAPGIQALRSITSNRRAYVLRPATLRATNGTVVFCDERGASHARAVILSYTGRPRVTSRASSGAALACPS